VLGVITFDRHRLHLRGDYPFAGLAWMVVTILSIMKAVKGERFKIPGISDFADKF